VLFSCLAFASDHPLRLTRLGRATHSREQHNAEREGNGQLVFHAFKQHVDFVRCIPRRFFTHHNSSFRGFVKGSVYR
jgi:hypothetical protein